MSKFLTYLSRGLFPAPSNPRCLQGALAHLPWLPSGPAVVMGTICTHRQQLWCGVFSCSPMSSTSMHEAGLSSWSSRLSTTRRLSLWALPWIHLAFLSILISGHSSLCHGAPWLWLSATDCPFSPKSFSTHKPPQLLQPFLFYTPKAVS